MRYSALQIIKQGLTGNKGWTPAWREPEPKTDYQYRSKHHYYSIELHAARQ